MNDLQSTETQQDLETGIGTKELEKLKPATVKIIKPEIRSVGDKANKKVVCQVKHPDKEESIDISSVKYLKDDKAIVTGLWYNLDDDKLIRKGSPLSVFMEFINAGNLRELVDKEIQTVHDDKGYLCFKAY